MTFWKIYMDKMRFYFFIYSVQKIHLFGVMIQKTSFPYVHKQNYFSNHFTQKSYNFIDAQYFSEIPLVENEKF